MVFNARSHFGYVGAYSSEIGSSPFEQFRLGGTGITGFNFLLGYDLIGLRGYPDPQQTVSERNRGKLSYPGIAFSKYVAEVRYALSKQPAATIWLHSFAEAGNNWTEARRVSPFNVYRSVGVGARLFMPAFGGLIGVDFAFPMDELPGGNPQTSYFHFTLGQQIR